METYPKGDPRFHLVLTELGDLHDRKQADYGSEESPFTKLDPFANVRGSVEWGIEPWVGVGVRISDKIRRLQKAARTGKLANESVEDAFLDLAVYGIIGLILWRESEAEVEVQHGPHYALGDLEARTEREDGVKVEVIDVTRPRGVSVEDGDDWYITGEVPM